MSDEGPSVAQFAAEIERLRAENEAFREKHGEPKMPRGLSTPELIDENERLNRENAALREEYGWKERFALGAGKLGLGVAAGPDLATSLDGYFERKRWWRPTPQPEMQNLTAAVIRRFVRVRTFTLVVAALVALPGTMLLWLQLERLDYQNDIVAQQNTLVALQNKYFRELTEQQVSEARLARRARLLGTVYDRTECGAKDRNACPHKASDRARRDAAEALVALAGKGRRARLMSADFAGLNLVGAKLSRAHLAGANLEGASLSHADLEGASLAGANLRSVRLHEANLRGTLLHETDLTGTRLLGVDLHGAHLARNSPGPLNPSNEWFYSFSNARVSEEQVAFASGDSNTVLPLGYRRPCWWEGVECEGKVGNGTPPEARADYLPED